MLLSQTLRPAGWLLVSAIEIPFIKNNQLKIVNIGRIALFQKLTGKAIPQANEEKLSSLLKIVPSLLNQEFSNQLVSSPVISNVDLPSKDPQHLFQKNKKENLWAQIQDCANSGKMEEALTYCKEALDKERLNPELHYWQAIILQALDDNEGAIKALKRVIYLDSSFALAHYLLGVLEMKLAHHKEAERHLKHAQALLVKCDPEALVPGSENMNVATLLDAITALCRKHKNLKKSH